MDPTCLGESLSASQGRAEREVRKDPGRMKRALQGIQNKIAESPALNFPEAKILEKSCHATDQAHEQAAPWAQPALRGQQMTAPTALALPCQRR